MAGKIDSGLVLTTVSAILQRVPDPDLFHRGGLTGKVSERISQDEFTEYFMRNGYRRAATVREAGEYAFRGSIVDVFPPGALEPYRLDFFGDELETIRTFDPMSQRTTGNEEAFALGPVSEIAFDNTSNERFREGYRRLLAHRLAPILCMRRLAPVPIIPAWNTGCRCFMSGWRRFLTMCPTP